MIQTHVYIMGMPVSIMYEIHSFFNIEWAVKMPPPSSTNETSIYLLLNVLLRVHYCEFIEAEIRRYHHTLEYEENINPPHPLFDKEEIPF